MKSLARSERFELPTPRFEVWCSIQLSYERLPTPPLEATAAVLDHVPAELNRHYIRVSISQHQPGCSARAAQHPLRLEQLVDTAADVRRKPDPRLVVDTAAGISERLDRPPGAEAVARLLVIGVALEPQGLAILAPQSWALAADTGAATTKAAMAVAIKRRR